MRPVATDVTRSVVCVSVCVFVTQVCCQKWLNRSWCCVGADLHEPREPCIR